MKLINNLVLVYDIKHEFGQHYRAVSQICDIIFQESPYASKLCLVDTYLKNGVNICGINIHDTIIL